LVAFGVAGCGNGDPAVAVVNDEEISQAEFNSRIEQMRTAYESQGMELDDATLGQIEEQTLETMIDETLLTQEATEAGLTPSDDEVDEAMEAQTAQFPDEESLNEALEGAGLDEEGLRDLIAQQLSIQRYIEAQMEDAGGAEVTDEEIEALYEQYSSQTEEMPPLEDIRPQLEAELQQQQQGAAVQQIVDDLRESADIEILT
ncbi:MAG: SurA N-terminal domain-containing protein, partial [Dehalococcoidia bacterium]